MNPKIVFTGGGTAGHVTPNLALIEAVQKEGWQVDYIGSQNGVEASMIKNLNLSYHAISSGKLRRYFSLQNFLDPFRILKGIAQAYRLLSKLETDIVFSKGGFVAFPVVFAAWLKRIPILAHESDLTPGLANTLSFPFVNKICVNFAASTAYFKRKEKVEVTGTPIRSALFKGSKEGGLNRCGFKDGKPCVLIIGGSLGSAVLNSVIRESLPTLSNNFSIIHLCGKDKIDQNLANNPSYYQYEYANEEMPDLFAASDFVISRAGANSVYEILALKKPHLLVPLSKKASRGDQIQNARYFEEQGISLVIDEEKFSTETLIEAMSRISKEQESIREKITKLDIQSATDKILSLIKDQIFHTAIANKKN
jgi:UDP-N-acetylglucosamine--N-acetylmuramyl-(pentapeptide) pyrophosphoryl-undecaprenol N-acetylglucosamine transferase